MMDIAMWLGLAVVATAVVGKGSEWLGDSANGLAAGFGVPAVFNLLVVPGIAALVGGQMDANRDLVHEAQFYSWQLSIDNTPSVGGAR